MSEVVILVVSKGTKEGLLNICVSFGGSVDAKTDRIVPIGRGFRELGIHLKKEFPDIVPAVLNGCKYNSKNLFKI